MAGIKQAYEVHRGFVRAAMLIAVAVVAAIVAIQVLTNGVQCSDHCERRCLYRRVAQALVCDRLACVVV